MAIRWVGMMIGVADRRWFRVFASYLVAVVATYVLATLAATQWTLGSFEQMGYEVTATQRLTTTVQDLFGMLPSYGLVIAVAMAIGLSVASRIADFVPTLRGVGLVVAGVAALLGIHLITQQLLDVSPIPVARSIGGLLAQGLAGGIGGYLYYLLRRS